MPKTDDKEHLKILSPAEIKALYGLPRFTQDEREQYFALTPAERTVRSISRIFHTFGDTSKGRGTGMPKTDDKEHLKILSPAEIKALYGLPRFTQDEREQYFALTPAERTVLEGLGSQKSRLYYVLQMDYFKARQRFFKFRTGEVEADAN